MGFTGGGLGKNIKESFKKEVVKMKRAIASAMVFAFVFFSTTSLFALPEPIQKFKGGAKDVLTSPLEIPKYTMDEVKGSHYKPLGLIGGVMKGSAHMLTKAASGVADIVTFPLK